MRFPRSLGAQARGRRGPPAGARLQAAAAKLDGRAIAVKRDLPAIEEAVHLAAGLRAERGQRRRLRGDNGQRCACAAIGEMACGEKRQLVQRHGPTIFDGTANTRRSATPTATSSTTARTSATDRGPVNVTVPGIAPPEPRRRRSPTRRTRSDAGHPPTPASRRPPPRRRCRTQAPRRHRRRSGRGQTNAPLQRRKAPPTAAGWDS